MPLDVHSLTITEQHIGMNVLAAAYPSSQVKIDKLSRSTPFEITVGTRDPEKHRGCFGKTQYMWEQDLFPEWFVSQYRLASATEAYEAGKCVVGYCKVIDVSMPDGGRAVYKIPRRTNFQDQKDELEYQDEFKYPWERQMSEWCGQSLQEFNDAWQAWLQAKRFNTGRGGWRARP